MGDSDGGGVSTIGDDRIGVEISAIGVEASVGRAGDGIGVGFATTATGDEESGLTTGGNGGAGTDAFATVGVGTTGFATGAGTGAATVGAGFAIGATVGGGGGGGGGGGNSVVTIATTVPAAWQLSFSVNTTGTDRFISTGRGCVYPPNVSYPLFPPTP